MLYDLCVGAITSGVNKPTLLLLNAALALLWMSLAYLVFHTATTSGLSDLTPHFGLLLSCCTFLWILINWFVSNVGVVGAQEQQAQLDGSAAAAVDEIETLDAETQEKLRHLPLQSNIQVRCCCRRLR